MVELSKLFLNKPDIAVKVYIIVPLDSSNALLDELVKRNLLEPLPVEAASRELERIKHLVDLATKTSEVVDDLSRKLPNPVEVEIRELPWNVDEALNKLYTELLDVHRVVRALESELEKLKATLEKLEALEKLVDMLRASGLGEAVLDYEGSYVVVKTLYGDAESLSKLEQHALKTLARLDLAAGKAIEVLAFERGIYDSLRSELSNFEVNLSELEPRDLSQLALSVRRLSSDLKTRALSLEGKIREAVSSKTYELGLAKILSEVVLAKIGIVKEALESKYLTAIAGWTLKSKLNVTKEITSKFRGTVVVEKAQEPPVEFNNLKPFKPFELFTEIMGYPSPHEWDPTPFLTYLYLLFFALMFPDVGYGLGLIIGSRLVLPHFVENKETLNKLLKIATFAGIVGIITGVLSGSFFGSLLGVYISRLIPSMLPSLPPRLSAIEDVGRAVLNYIGLALIIGYFAVLLSHGIGLAKNIKLRNKPGVLFESTIILLMIATPPAIKTALNLNVDVLSLCSVVPGDIWVKVSLALFVLYGISKAIIDRPFGALLWIFDLLGIMADVLSFVRIAGIAVGSAIMAELLNSLVLSTTSLLSGFSMVGFIVGFVLAATLHVVNLGLSSISPFVHSLRLIMYEVSSKFYEGGGRKIKPAGPQALIVKIGGSR